MEGMILAYTLLMVAPAYHPAAIPSAVAVAEYTNTEDCMDAKGWIEEHQTDKTQGYVFCLNVWKEPEGEEI
ncbi:hypothetical protein HYO98_gp07 [Dinoroseobacter phage DS-1410Ws-06]|uniref:Uncharacterized protein n=1 Tax=Dinoroseobacter phage DS-1410Ws-06 TaxID=1815983 RepID=A0A191VY74_9CAUD|nr:hypothetical protein HYO98_gp07 [Dinoroseobacter phage DS-1410Ws-06]ANJ20664.1 hypothetical protein DSp06_gp07 [Dinoroseobacter phage DS-1410Ws-06]